MKGFGKVFVSLLSVGGLLFVAFITVGQAAEPQYVGNKKCVGCHREQNKAWLEDYHAKAFDSLKPGVKAEVKTKGKLDPNKDYSADAGCLECHATGYGKAADPKADLSNVGCESCHGPGSEYKNVKIMNKKKFQENRETQHQMAVQAGLIEPTEALCVACHNDKSPTWKGFDYKKMIEEVKHKKEPAK